MDIGSNHGDTGAHLKRLIEMDKSALPPDGGERFNRLIFAGSPYLLQHAENPVDWYQWGDEAFAKAEAEDKPVFLSIGYATCHWCHVMAHESFEDREVAAVLNRHFVAIKVDREERPEIDERYMTVSQLMTGSGGWPLNVFMGPDKRPFLTVTYVPKRARMGMPGFIELMENIATLWRTQRDRVERNCSDVMASLRQTAVPASGAVPETDLAGSAFRQLDAMYDPEWGGFGSAPKFPMPVYLSFLLRFSKWRGADRARAMTEQTLRKMRRGGIWDQIGFGFHRYSVDREWLVPHFEKMLYDQALIATAYIEAWRVNGDPFFRTVAEEILDFVMRELTAPEGGFYSALDADTEGEEGKFYVWDEGEILTVLGEEEGELFCRLFGVTARGNFEGANILYLPLDVQAFTEQEGMPPEKLAEALARGRLKLMEARSERIRPFRDEKIVTAWNGLMIAACAEGYAATGDERYLSAAEKAADFAQKHLTSPKGRLMRSFHAGSASVPAVMDDYAFLVHGLVALYEATLDKGRLDEALRLSGEMLRLFRDKASGGLFDTGADAEEVLVRGLDASDNVIPAGNAVAARNLVKLGRITGDDKLTAAGEAILRAFMAGAARQPAGYLTLLTAWEMLKGEAVEIALIGQREAAEIGAMLRVIGRRFIPNLVVTFKEESDVAAEAHVCALGACRPPVRGAEGLARLLDEMLK